MSAHHDDIYLFGGLFENYSLPATDPNSVIFYDNLFRFDTSRDKWTLLTSGEGPSPRAFQLAAVDPIYDRLLIYGGVMYSSDFSVIKVFSDFWQFSFHSGRWSLVNPVSTANPGKRASGGMAYHNGVVYLFGGITDESFTPSNDLWAFNIQTNSWKQLIPNGVPGSPPKRNSFIFLASPKENKLFLYGGQALNPNTGAFDTFNDTWEYSICCNKWTDVTPPPTRNIFPPVNDFSSAAIVDHTMILYGGEQNVDPVVCPPPIVPQGPTNNTWLLNTKVPFKGYIKLDTDDHTPPPLKRQAGTNVGRCFFLYGGFSFPSCAVGQIYNTDVWAIRVPELH